jgi:hypothetical protein
MKATKWYFIIILFALLACDNEYDRTFSSADGEFVRFFVLVDNDNNVLEYPQNNSGLVPVETYTKSRLGQLKIPVALSKQQVENDITVNFESNISDNLQGVVISPQNTLNFAQNKLIDTIYIDFNNSWNGLNSASIQLELTNSSDASVNIGVPNEQLTYKTLNINLEDVEFNYALNKSLEEVVGSVNEEIFIEVDFPNGFFEEDIANTDLLNEIENSPNAQDMSYDLSLHSINESERKVIYKFSITADLDDSFLFETKLELADLDGYTKTGITQITIRKPILVDRDNSVNTAANFYNLDDPFNRTFGENWMDFNEDGVCDWQPFNAFTYPVVVDATHPNAVQYSGMDTPNDPSDDVYHHAFRVGFNSPNQGNSTNSFNLRRWFNNESTNSANSPGFNITEALDFYPENGNSTTNGFLQVVAQDIVVAGTNGNSYTISISGSGTYAEISPGIFEIQLELQATNSALFGGSRTAFYYIYNTSDFAEPQPLNEGCFTPVDL